MVIITEGHAYRYESEKIARIFYPREKVSFCGSPAEAPADPRTLLTRVERRDGYTAFFCRARLDGRAAEAEETFDACEVPDDPACEKALARVMVRALSAITGITPPWGILTGVRPSKLMRRCVADLGEEGAASRFTEYFGVSPEKTRLAMDIERRQRPLVQANAPRDVSIYVSVPFCPTRCSYCSFVSHSVEGAKKLIPDYLRFLREEIALTAETAAALGLRVKSVYVGGGTPTVLSAAELETLLAALDRAFRADTCGEFTVEAGRPDTVTAEKLAVLRAAGVTRVSVNPQTFSDAVLNEIGRRHTAAETEDAFRLAREAGFESVNMDLIAGLPTDTFGSFRESLIKAVSLAPENITVHTLALKRAAALASEAETHAAAEETARMLSFVSERLYAAGYAPYYLYRQSKSAGNLENVGWAKPGKMCLYNVYMMEELHSVLACGGGAVTRLVSPDGARIERIYNFKYPYEYVGRFSEIAARKAQIAAFYRDLTG